LNLIVLSGLLYLGGHTPALANGQEHGQPTVDKHAGSGITLTWTPLQYGLSSVTTEGGTFSRIQLPHTHLSGRPGYPQLPLYSGLVGLPQSGEAIIEVIEVEREVVQLPHVPIPVPVPQPVQFSPRDVDPEIVVNGGPTARLPDPEIYTTDAFYPADIAQLGEPQRVRNYRVSTLKIYPLRVNPVTRQLEVIRYLRLQIAFTDAPSANPIFTLQQAEPDPFSHVFGATLLNPEARQWPVEDVDDVSGLSQDPLSGLVTSQSVKVFIDEAGLYELTYTDLQNAGLPVDSLNPQSFKLSYGFPRQEVAILVEGEADGHFDADDRLLFYANPTFSRYVDHDVYFLGYGGAPSGLRVTSRSGNPAALPAGTAWRQILVETNTFYDPLYAGRDGDHWYWAKLAQPADNSGSYSIPVQALLVAGPDAKLQVWLQGYTAHPIQNPDHRVQFKVNENPVGAVEWDGKTGYVASLNVSTNYLTVGQNQVRLVLPGILGVFAEGVWLDAMSLTYPTGQASAGQFHFRGEAGQKKYILTGLNSAPLVFDVTNPDAPQLVTDYAFNNTTLTVGDSNTAAATYLIVPESHINKPFSV
jgi:hypothetical protein